ncbi:TBC1 domain family member 20 [Perkinsela sp. CCAP 1560/4]|nr:TBC1 domain family member 20 [Perkinsela sp. CCAP 1560/4]|eukprot:KNH08204.1 TBC1 domain family member 20 [Perkinsela sp. CCAP 1560/4]
MRVFENDLDRLLTALGYENEHELLRYRMSVRKVVCSTLTANPDMKYFQGLHDIAFVCIKVCGDASGNIVFQSLCRYWLREYLAETLKPAEEICQMVNVVVSHVNPKLGALLREKGHERGYFALSWILTLYTHTLLNDIPAVSRILDFFFATHPLALSPYVAAAIVLDNAHELFKLSKSGGDHADFHQLLTNLPHKRNTHKSNFLKRIWDNPLPSDVSHWSESFVSIPRIFDAVRQLPPSVLFDADITHFRSVHQGGKTASPTKYTSKDENVKRKRVVLPWVDVISDYARKAEFREQSYSVPATRPLLICLCIALSISSAFLFRHFADPHA